jgi:hypothetical protein
VRVDKSGCVVCEITMEVSTLAGDGDIYAANESGQVLQIDTNEQ